MALSNKDRDTTLSILTFLDTAAAQMRDARNTGNNQEVASIRDSAVTQVKNTMKKTNLNDGPGSVAKLGEFVTDAESDESLRNIIKDSTDNRVDADTSGAALACWASILIDEGEDIQRVIDVFNRLIGKIKAVSAEIGNLISPITAESLQNGVMCGLCPTGKIVDPSTRNCVSAPSGPSPATCSACAPRCEVCPADKDKCITTYTACTLGEGCATKCDSCTPDKAKCITTYTACTLGEGCTTKCDSCTPDKDKCISTYTACTLGEGCTTKCDSCPPDAAKCAAQYPCPVCPTIPPPPPPPPFSCPVCPSPPPPPPLGTVIDPPCGARKYRRGDKCLSCYGSVVTNLNATNIVGFAIAAVVRYSLGKAVNVTGQSPLYLNRAMEIYDIHNSGRSLWKPVIENEVISYCGNLVRGLNWAACKLAQIMYDAAPNNDLAYPSTPSNYLYYGKEALEDTDVYPPITKPNAAVAALNAIDVNSIGINLLSIDQITYDAFSSNPAKNVPRVFSCAAAGVQVEGRTTTYANVMCCEDYHQSIIGDGDQCRCITVVDL